MFDIGWQELFLISVVALIVVGPKDLPKVLRTGARMLNKARAMSREFQAGLAEIAREAELDELKRNVERAAHFDPAEELKRAVDPTGKFTEDFDPMEFNRKLKAAVEGGPPTGPATPQPETQERVPGSEGTSPSPPQTATGTMDGVASSEALQSETSSPVFHPDLKHPVEPDVQPEVDRRTGTPDADSPPAVPGNTAAHR